MTPSQNSCADMSYNEVHPSDGSGGTADEPTRSQSSHLEWDDTKFNFLNKCLIECEPSTSGGNKQHTVDESHSLCDDNHCDKMKALPTDWFTRTDDCYELAEYDTKDSEGKDMKITIEQDTTAIQEL